MIRYIGFPVACLLISLALAAVEPPPLAYHTDTGILLRGDTRTALRNLTATELIQQMGKFPLTKSDAQQIIASLKDSINAHYVALTFYEQALKSFKSTSSDADLKTMLKNIETCAASSKRALSDLKIWEERAQYLRD